MRANPIVAALVTAACLSVWAPRADPAAAASYVHASCHAQWPGSDRWRPVQSGIFGQQSISDSRCPAGGGLHSELWPTPQRPAFGGEGPGWVYDAPPETVVESLSFSLTGWLGDIPGVVGEFVVRSDRQMLYRAIAADNASIYPARRRIDSGQISASRLSAMLTCAAYTFDARCDSWNTGWVDFKDVDVRLGDGLAPQPSADVGGAITSTLVLSGATGAQISASDRGGGLREARLFADGRQVAVAPFAAGPCEPVSTTPSGEWVFAAAAPCPRSATLDASFDTRAIADGTRSLAIVIVDAAQNQTVVWNGERTIANNPPVNVLPPHLTVLDAAAPRVGEAVVADAGVWSGPNLLFKYQWERCAPDRSQCDPITGATGLVYTPTPGDLGRRLRLAVTARNVVPVSAHSEYTGVVTEATVSGQARALNGSLEGGEICPEEAVVLTAPARRDGVVRLRHGSRTSVTVRLSCALDGRPVAGAVLRSATRVPGRDGAVGGRVVTDRRGEAVLRVAAGPSRYVTVGYRLFSDDPVDRASLQLQVTVRNRITMRVRKRGGLTRFSGRLSGGHVPRRGTTIQIQWRDGRRWRPVATVHTNRSGAYRYSYRFSRRARGFKYRFRAVVGRGQTDYPFLPARSPVRLAGR